MSDGGRGHCVPESEAPYSPIDAATDFCPMPPPLKVIRGVTKLSAAAQLAKNKAAGSAFEKQAMQKVQQTQTGVVEQVTVQTESGVKTRVDLIGRDANGNIICTECKASSSAPLTPNQKAAFPEIQQSGGTVVGQGKPGFPGGTVIPPTTVNVIRP